MSQPKITNYMNENVLKINIFENSVWTSEYDDHFINLHSIYPYFKWLWTYMIHVFTYDMCNTWPFSKNKLKKFYPNFVNYTKEPPLDPMGYCILQEVERLETLGPLLDGGPTFHWVSSFDNFFHGIPKYSTIN